MAARRLRGSLWATDAAPWDDSLSLTNHEWDVQWGLNFGSRFGAFWTDLSGARAAMAAVAK